jgi:hypothetical protein
MGRPGGTGPSSNVSPARPARPRSTRRRPVTEGPADQEADDLGGVGVGVGVQSQLAEASVGIAVDDDPDLLAALEPPPNDPESDHLAAGAALKGVRQ